MRRQCSDSDRVPQGTRSTRPSSGRLPLAQILEIVVAGQIPLRFTAYDGSATGPDDALGFDLVTPRGTTYLATAPGELGLARAYVSGDLQPLGVHPGDPYQLLKALNDDVEVRRPSPRLLAAIVRSIGVQHLVPIAPPPQEVPPRWRRTVQGLRHSRNRDAEAISHHYDVSNTFYEWVLGPSMTYTCACYPHADATLQEAQANKYRLVFDKLRLQAGDRLLDVGCGWGSMVRYAARRGVQATGITLSAEQAAWAQQAIAEEGTDRAGRGSARRLPRDPGDGVRCGVLDRSDRAHRRRPTTPPTSRSSGPGCGPVACCSTTASPGPTTGPRLPRAGSSTATSSPTGS